MSLQPPLIYLIVRKPPASSIHFYASWFCIVFGLIVTVFGEPWQPLPASFCTCVQSHRLKLLIRSEKFLWNM